MTESQPHIVIIGAGLIGLSCADSLLVDGAKVTILEARSSTVRGTSFANSGMIHPSQSWGWIQAHPDKDASENVHVFAMQSRDMLLRRMESLGLTAMQGRSRGCYQMHETVEAADRAQVDYDRLGIRANRVMDPVSTFGRPSLYFPDDRSGDARLYGQVLCEAVQAAGAILITEATDVRLTRIGADQVSVRLGAHHFNADHVIVACGAQSPDVLGQIGFSLPVTSNRGWATDFEVPIGLALANVPVMDALTRSALTPFRDRIRLSGTLGEDSAKTLLSRWAEILPVPMKALGVPRQLWSGLRPMSETGAPIIGRVANGLWVNAGHAHMGWTLCAASGQLMADLIARKRVESPFAYGDAIEVFAE